MKIFLKQLSIPFLIGLVFSAILLTIVFFFNSDLNPRVLSHNHKIELIRNNDEGVHGSFTAIENYLGIISVRFEKNILLNGNSIFRIKNVLDKDWYHEATISANQYYTVPLYPFGLPIITKSKGQKYEFDIKLIDNNPGSPDLSLSSQYPVLISQYAFPRNVLITNKAIFFNFIINKIGYYISSESAWKVFSVYSIPFFIYSIYKILRIFFDFSIFKLYIKNKLTTILKPSVLFIFLNIFIDIFIIRKYSNMSIYIFILLWVLSVIAYKLESHYSFGAAFIFLLFCPFLLSANMDWVAEKSAIWSYMFLVVGTLHAIIELKLRSSIHLRSFFDYLSSKLVFFIYLDLLLIAIVKNINTFAHFSRRHFLATIVIFILSVAIIMSGVDLYLRFMSYRDRLLKNPGIPIVEPSLVYPGTKVFLYGDRFGDNSNNKYALMKDGERVRVDYWEDHKIIFTVPLGWNPGEMKIWIEKPIEWNAETIIVKTKPITIKLLKVGGKFTTDDDLYFEQLKTWRKETKEINGYK